MLGRLGSYDSVRRFLQRPLGSTGQLGPRTELAEALFGEAPDDGVEKKKRSAKVSRLIRLLRGHGILKKVPKSHRYQVCQKSRDALTALLVARKANVETLTGKAA